MFSRRSTRQTFTVLFTAALLLTSCNIGSTAVPTQDISALSTALVGTTVAQLSVQFTETAQAAPTNTAAPIDTAASLPTLALPTLDLSAAASPTANPAALPTFSFADTPVVANTPIAGNTPVSAVPTAPAPVVATSASGDACNNDVFIQDTTVPDGTIMKPGEDFFKVWRIKNTGNCTWDDGYSLVLVSGDNLDGPTYKIKQKNDFVAPGQIVDIGIHMTAHLKPGTYTGCWKMLNDRGYYFGSYLCVTIKVVKP